MMDSKKAKSLAMAKALLFLFLFQESCLEFHNDNVLYELV